MQNTYRTNVYTNIFYQFKWISLPGIFVSWHHVKMTTNEPNGSTGPLWCVSYNEVTPSLHVYHMVQSQGTTIGSGEGSEEVQNMLYSSVSRKYNSVKYNYVRVCIVVYQYCFWGHKQGRI